MSAIKTSKMGELTANNQVTLKYPISPLYVKLYPSGKCGEVCIRTIRNGKHIEGLDKYVYMFSVEYEKIFISQVYHKHSGAYSYGFSIIPKGETLPTGIIWIVFSYSPEPKLDDETQKSVTGNQASVRPSKKANISLDHADNVVSSSSGSYHYECNICGLEEEYDEDYGKEISCTFCINGTLKRNDII